MTYIVFWLHLRDSLYLTCMKKRHKLISLFTIVLLLTSIVSVPAYAQKKNSKTKKVTKPVAISIDTVAIDYTKHKAPVISFHDTLFYIYGNIGSVSAKQRAETIEGNIARLADDWKFNPDSLKIIVSDNNYLISYNDETILGITKMQSTVLGKPMEEIATEYIDIISNSIKQERERYSWQSILKQVGLSLLILLVTYFCIKYLNIFIRKIRLLITKKKDLLTIQKISTLLDTNKQMYLIILLVRIIRFVLVIIILYLCAFAFFSLFPATRWLADTLLSYILSPLNAVFLSVKNYVPNLFSIIVIVVLFRFMIKGIRVVAEKIADQSISLKGFYPDWAVPTFNIVKVILYIFMFILIFPHLPGSNSPAFQGVSVFLGVLFSLGSTSIIGNIVSGIVITYMRPFKLGDRIKMGEFLGNVIEKTPLVTRIKTPKNEIITIPNGNIMSAQTINYTQSAADYGLILYAKVTMGYEIPWRRVHELLLEAGTNTPHVLKDPKPFVLQLALDDFYVEYQINIYTDQADLMSGIYSDLYKNVQDVFNREGIEILSPHYRAQRDGSEVTMPKEFIQNNKFRTPPFNMQVQIKKEGEA